MLLRQAVAAAARPIEALLRNCRRDFDMFFSEPHCTGGSRPQARRTQENRPRREPCGITMRKDRALERGVSLCHTFPPPAAESIAEPPGQRLFRHVRPHRQLVAVRVSKMKSTAAGKRKGILHYRSARGFDLLLGRVQVPGVNHEQQALAWRRRILRKAPGQAAVEKARVAGPIVLKCPPEDSSVELLGGLYLARRQFNIVDLVFISWSAHRLLILRPSAPRTVARQPAISR